MLQSLAKHEAGRFSLPGLLGRPPIELDPRVTPSQPEGPTAAEMELFEKAGIPGGVMSDDELAQAYAELTP